MPRISKRTYREPTGWRRWAPLVFLAAFGIGIVGLALYIGIHNIIVESPEWKSRVHEDFPGIEEAQILGPVQKKRLIETANKEHCPCQCGHTIASCLKGDLSCPITDQNKKRLRQLIQNLHKGGDLT